MKKTVIGGLFIGFMLFTVAGCGKGKETPYSEQTNASSDLTSEQTDTVSELNYNPVIEAKDFDSSWSIETATQILLSDEECKIDGEGAVSLEGGIKISKGGEYVISGKLSDGRIIVDIERGEELKLVLSGVDITSSVSAPIYISNGDAMIILAEDTENVLTDCSAYQYADNTVKEPNACLYGDDDITVIGKGKLTVNANFNNGIGTKDELRIVSGTIVVYAINNALKGNDCVLIQDASIHIESKGDGIKSDEKGLEGYGVISIINSNVEIIADDDGLQAVSLISVEGGRITAAVKGKKVNCDGVINIAEGILQ